MKNTRLTFRSIQANVFVFIQKRYEYCIKEKQKYNIEKAKPEVACNYKKQYRKLSGKHLTTIKPLTPESLEKVIKLQHQYGQTKGGTQLVPPFSWSILTPKWYKSIDKSKIYFSFTKR